MYEDLERLNTLRDKGAITEEEFQKEKKKILDAAEPSTELVHVPKNLWGMDERSFLTLLHISQFSGIIIPLAGYLLPLFMWITNKEESEQVDKHGRVVLNWIISLAIYSAISTILAFIYIGYLGLFILFVCNIIFVIKGTMNASKGILWPYPLSLKLL